MSVEVERATVACGTCGAQVIELRRGRCWGCYTALGRVAPRGRGATCTVCFEKRRDQLKLARIARPHGARLCHGCSAHVTRMDEIPESIERPAHRAAERTGAMPTSASGRWTTASSRASAAWASAQPAASAFADTDPRMEATLLAEMEEIIVELQEADMEEVEQTQVRENYAATPPPLPST